MQVYIPNIFHYWNLPMIHKLWLPSLILRSPKKVFRSTIQDPGIMVIWPCQSNLAVGSTFVTFGHGHLDLQKSPVRNPQQSSVQGQANSSTEIW